MANVRQIQTAASKSCVYENFTEAYFPLKNGKYLCDEGDGAIIIINNHELSGIIFSSSKIAEEGLMQIAQMRHEYDEDLDSLTA